MTNDTQRNICPKCQGPIPEDAPGGLCPKCVMAGVGTSGVQTGTDLGDVPSIERLRPLFPQLEIMELIGRGGMGFVFKARQLHLDREVALKLLPEKFGADPHFAERFTREARVLAKLNHPNIVMVHDFGHAGGFYYLTMEYVEGLNLRQAMRMGKFSPAEALAIVPKICEALQFAHEQGVLHRDIKPENLLIDVQGRVKIADFGIAKLVGEENRPATLTGTGASLGTPHYMAPEQFENPAQVDHRADIYSLGVVFYEMLTGELPLGRFSAPSERAELDFRIDAIVLRALARERDLRQKDARELQTEVETVARSAPEAARAETVSSEVNPLRRFWLAHGNKLGWATAAVVFLLLVGSIVVQQTNRRRLVAVIQEIPQTKVAPVAKSTDPASDAAKRQREDEAIEQARERYEEAKAKHVRSEITDRELALANRDVVMAEARGDNLAIAKAHYDFVEWEMQQLLKDRFPDIEARFKLQQELNKANHAIERAKAGTNRVEQAAADLKYAERAWGIAHGQRNTRIERNGVITNFIAAETLKKLENDMLYAKLHYNQVKQKAEATK